MMASIIWYKILDSTNNEAVRQINSAPEQTFFAAEFQTDGKGQKGNRWESEVGMNLTFSILLKPSFLKIESQFIVSQIVTLSLKRYFKSIGVDVKIKWPNDIYVERKKICGILIENHFSSVNLAVSIVGIGINVNQSVFKSDAPNPTSLFLETGKNYNLKDEMESFAAIFNEEYSNFVQSHNLELENNLNNRYTESLYNLREFHLYQNLLNGEIFNGQIIGIDKNACVIIEKESGETQSYAFKEIKYL